MSFKSTRQALAKDLEAIKANGLWKTERHIDSDQKSAITLADGSEVINMVKIGKFECVNVFKRVFGDISKFLR